MIINQWAGFKPRVLSTVATRTNHDATPLIPPQCQSKSRRSNWQEIWRRRTSSGMCVVQRCGYTAILRIVVVHQILCLNNTSDIRIAWYCNIWNSKVLTADAKSFICQVLATHLVHLDGALYADLVSGRNRKKKKKKERKENKVLFFTVCTSKLPQSVQNSATCISLSESYFAVQVVTSLLVYMNINMLTKLWQQPLQLH